MVQSFHDKRRLSEDRVHVGSVERSGSALRNFESR